MSQANDFDCLFDDDDEEDASDDRLGSLWQSTDDRLVATLMNTLQGSFEMPFKSAPIDFSDINLFVEATRVRLLAEMKTSVLPLQMFVLSNMAGGHASFSFDTGLVDSPANEMFGTVVTRVLASGCVPAYVLLLSFWRAKTAEVAPHGYQIMNAANAVSREEVMVMIGCNTNQRVVKTFKVDRDPAGTVSALDEADMSPPTDDLSITRNLFHSISMLDESEIPVMPKRVLH